MPAHWHVVIINLLESWDAERYSSYGPVIDKSSVLMRCSRRHRSYRTLRVHRANLVAQWTISKSRSMAVYVHTPVIKRAVDTSMTPITTPATARSGSMCGTQRPATGLAKAWPPRHGRKLSGIAAETLGGMDPEIAAARAVKNDRTPRLPRN
jgi:hypothetical protein